LDLKAIIKDPSFKGILVVSDIHATLKPLLEAVAYAQQNRLFLLFLGDVVDDGKSPFETVQVIKNCLDEGIAALVLGNHDEKWYRYAIGKPVPLTLTAINTLFDVPSEKEYEFLDLMVYISEHACTGLYFRYDCWSFTHGAYPETMWESTEIKTPSKDERKLMLMGQITGKRDYRNFPIRDYMWCDAVPSNHNVVVGHDRAPLKKRFTASPTVYTNDLNGKVYFTDCGCGKRSTPRGRLCATVLDFKEDTLEFNKFEYF